MSKDFLNSKAWPFVEAHSILKKRGKILEKNENLKKKLKITDIFENNKMIHILIDIHLFLK